MGVHVPPALVLGQVVYSQERAAAEARAHFRDAWKAFDQREIRRRMWS